MIILENESLMVEISDMGAELCSVLDKKRGRERIHNADPKVWNRHSPLLFPFVGKVTGGVYRIDGKEYSMEEQHGFARDMKFECMYRDFRKTIHRLAANEDTKKKYPFDFELIVVHELNEENPDVLDIRWEVRNAGNDTMYYCIGGHPGFVTMEKEPAAKEEYYLGFPGKSAVTYCGVNKESGFVEPDKTTSVKLNDGMMKFHPDIYETLVFDHPEFSKVQILSPDKSPFITMECSEFPCFGIWTKREANYICLEPWVGRSDDHGFKGNIDEKIGIRTLLPYEKQIITYSIEFH